MPEALSGARAGSLLWRATSGETERLADLHLRAGEAVELVNSDALLVAKSYVEDGSDNSPWSIGERILAVMKDELDLPADVTLAAADVGHRPIFSDGLPRLGFLPQVAGLYVAAGHPGVILAPLIGRLAAEDMLEGRSAELLPRPQ